MLNFYSLCYDLVMEVDIPTKISQINNLFSLFSQKYQFNWETSPIIRSIPIAGKPDKPVLVHPTKVPKRRLGSREGHAGLLHALAHIEFNAINLALDACYRFQNMPYEYYTNWLEVANDEALHFNLLNNHLTSLGYRYGDFSAHNGLWDMAVKTEDDCLARMALVPRVLEARGIDAIPEMQIKISTIGDSRAMKILDIIHHDEIKHVKYGDKWFKYLCHQRNLNPEITFFELMDKFNAPKIRGAFNRIDRLKAGFSEYELNKLLPKSD